MANGKDEWLHKLRVEQTRKSRYERAFRRRKKENPELTFSDWQREALDRQASRDLAPVD